MTDSLRSNGSNNANVSETVWVMRKNQDFLVHGLYADDFLDFLNKNDFYLYFREQLKMCFDIKTSPVDVYLGIQICVEPNKL